MLNILAEVGNGDLVHKNIKNSLEEGLPLTVGTMMLIAGSVALVLDDLAIHMAMLVVLFMMNVTAVIVKQETIPITDFVRVIEDFHADYVNFNTYY